MLSQTAQLQVLGFVGAGVGGGLVFHLKGAYEAYSSTGNARMNGGVTTIVPAACHSNTAQTVG